MVEAVSSGGQVIPPMVILSSKLIMERWVTCTELEDNCLLAVSDSGYSNDQLSLDWVKHFEEFSRRGSTGSTRLLLLDGYGSHCTYEFLEYCDQHRIIVFCLPLHATHLLQPLDVVLFQPYKHWHKEVVDQATWTGCKDFNKIEFLYSLASIWHQTFKAASIKSAFQETGLILYNLEKVLMKMREMEPMRLVTLD